MQIERILSPRQQSAMPRVFVRKMMFYSVVGLHYVLIVALWIANGRQTCEGTEPSGVNSGLFLSDVRNSRIMLEENVSRHLSTAKYTTQRKADKEAVVPKSAKRGRHDKVQVEDKVVFLSYPSTTATREAHPLRSCPIARSPC